MNRIISSCLTCFLCFFPAALFAGDVVLLEASEEAVKGLNAQSSKLSFRDGAILVETEKSGAWPGFNMGRRDWNLKECAVLAIDVTNHGDRAINLNCRIDSPEVDFSTMQGTYTRSGAVGPGETKQLRIDLPALIPPQFKDKFFAMRGIPGGGQGPGHSGKTSTFHKDAVAGLVLFLNKPGRETRWSVRKIVAPADPNKQRLAWEKMSVDEFFPMIDRFGQFKHEDWPGKIKSEDDMRKRAAEEEADLARKPGPENRSLYGGHAAGPKLEATGHFRVEKRDGVWWLVDPEGYLFWSHGCDCVHFGNAVTPITDREFYFEGLPAKDDPVYKSCYSKGWWAPHNYYENKTPYDTFDFTRANLLRKFGDDWRAKSVDLAHRRLKSWGMNTIANWSDRGVCEKRQTPYTWQFGSGGRRIEGSGGYWGKFPDPFSKEFEDNVEKNAQNEKNRTAEDPWCVGYFVDNEISWGDERSLAIGALLSPADQPAKIAFVGELKNKYGGIGKLNEAWGTGYADWDALLRSTEKPDENKAGADLDLFHRKVAAKYFKTIRDALKKAAPNKLYLGCRFAWGNDTAIRESAEYCDVVSFNRYQRTLEALKLPEGVDKPVVIGEFHFGALDRGMFHTGLVPVDSQEKRAEAYETYVRSALEHPLIVGTHWFQFGDQATTGRSDGENYQIGLLNVVDAPYPETIEAVRKVGYRLYEIRLKK